MLSPYRLAATLFANELYIFTPQICAAESDTGRETRL
jgi:hypothetical protein